MRSPASRQFFATAVAFAALALSAASCRRYPRETMIVSMAREAPTPDPRVGLGAGWFDAGQALWNLRLVSTTPPGPNFLNPSTPGDRRLTNSDLAFRGNLAFQGNYSGWQVWDISNPARPRLRKDYVCPGSQSDVTVYGNLLFVSAEATSGRVDCGLEGVTDTVSMERARGIRIIDISDIDNPTYVTTVQTCRGSHTNTLVTAPNDPEHVYIYVSGSAGVRSPTELAGCSGRPLDEDPNTALFRIEVIKVPVKDPAKAHIVSSPRIFAGLEAAAPPRHGETPRDIEARRQRAIAAGRNPDEATRPPRRRTGPTQCHDITTYPAVGLAGGACAGYGFLLDITDVANPRRIEQVADSNMSFWHSATFNNDGTKVLFSDEWGGGTQPRCRATDKPEWGADAIFTIENGRMAFRSYFKLPAAQTEFENCVAHNGSLIPIPGRDVMVQSWYQGGINVFDWTDASNPIEIAYFDRGPMDGTKHVGGGLWSAYWYNGYVYGSEISRGLDVFELTPSYWISQNEIDAAKSVRLEQFNAQEQPRFVWPTTFTLARAYVDQLERGRGLPAERIAHIRAELAAAEQASSAQRSNTLTMLATQVGTDAGGSPDARRVRMLADALRLLSR